MLRKIKKFFIIITLLSILLNSFSSCKIKTSEPSRENDTTTNDVPADPPVNEETRYSIGGISDANFESEQFNKYWYMESTEGSVSIDTNDSYEGQGSLKIGSTGKYSSEVKQHIKSLKAGYYYLEAYVLNDGNQDYCYLYGKGTNQGECTTALPKSSDKWIKVVVRGIKVESDGVVEIGIRSNGDGQNAKIDNISLHYENNQSEQYESLFGGAISWLDWVEDLGGVYYHEDGTEADALQIMAENGCNFVRLELYNNPGDYVNEYGETFPKGYKDQDSILNLAARAKSKGMKIQLSFMYSDYWGNEAIPSDWLSEIDGLNDHDEIIEILTEKIYSYTKSYMQRLANLNIYPEYVSLGNEMEGGILLPYGCTYTTEEAMAAFCAFMDAGYRAVKEVSPSSKIVLHISCNASDMFYESQNGMGRWFFDLCEEYNINYDVIGTSFYPYWAQTDDIYATKKALDTTDLINWCNMMIDMYDKDILIMESGYNWGKPGQLSNNGAYSDIYPSTPEGQRDFMFELINAIKCVKDGRCVGDLYWDPILVRQSGIGYAIDATTGKSKPNCVETTTFFDYDHIALPVFDAYKYNRCGTSQAVIYGKLYDQHNQVLPNFIFSIEFNNVLYNVTTDKYGDYYLRLESGTDILHLDGYYVAVMTISPGDNHHTNFAIKVP